MTNTAGLSLRNLLILLALAGCGAAPSEPALAAGGHACAHQAEGCRGAHPREGDDHAAGHPGGCPSAHGHPDNHGRGGEHAHPAAAEHGAPHRRHHHDFSDVPRFARIFDDPARDAWQRPADVVRALDSSAGMTVADLGAGTGYFLPHLAAAVGPSGRILALDVEPGMVAHLQRRIRDAGLGQAEAREVAPDDPGLAPASVDRLLIVDTWHHIGDRERYAAHLRESLRPGGVLVVVDFTPESPHGPPPAMRIPASVVERELATAGFRTEVLATELPHQYVVRATPR